LFFPDQKYPTPNFDILKGKPSRPVRAVSQKKKTYNHPPEHSDDSCDDDYNPKGKRRSANKTRRSTKKIARQERKSSKSKFGKIPDDHFICE